MIADYKNKEFATRARRTYSLISQALQRYEADNGTPGDVSGLFNPSMTSFEVAENFSKYFNTLKLCQNSSSAQCKRFYPEIAYASAIYDKNGEATYQGLGGFPLFVVNDGSTIVVRMYPSCEEDVVYTKYNPDGTLAKDDDGNLITYEATRRYCAVLYFDTNGPAGPNKFGADAFGILIDQKGITKNGDWAAIGSNSLYNILQGGNPIYTKYNKGDKVK